jgi:cytochrome c oxidase subunit 2
MITSVKRIAACALVLASVLAFGIAAESAMPKERTIRITAKRFNYAPGEVTLKKGVPVVLEFTSLDVVMGFNLPDFNVRADILPGTVTRLRLVPDKTGTFVFLCDVFCGVGHEEMNGRVTVVE